MDILCDRLHLLDLAKAPLGHVEEVELVECADQLVALLGYLVVAQKHGTLGKLQEVVLLLQLTGRLKCNEYVSTCDSQVESLFEVLLEEQGNL